MKVPDSDNGEGMLACTDSLTLDRAFPFGMFILTDEQHRLVVRAAAAQNITNKPDIDGISSLALFVLRILTDYSDASFSSDNLALLANRFYG